MAEREEGGKFQKAFDLFDEDGTGSIRCVRVCVHRCMMLPPL
jgi:Ca2+-binding EF-hand superfamily protein